MNAEKITIEMGNGDVVSAVMAGPDKPGTRHATGLIIAHGAGNDMTHPLIVAVAETLARSGFITLRFNFPYKEKGKKAPDSQKVLVDTWMKAYDHLKTKSEYPVTDIVAVGKSMGGRVASQMVAGGQLDVARMIFLGYPLHAPGRQDQLRDAHLYQIKVPLLFCAGTRDPLCNLDKLKGVLEKLNCPWDLEIIANGDHSFKLSKADKRTEQDVHAQICQTCLSWLSQ